MPEYKTTMKYLTNLLLACGIVLCGPAFSVSEQPPVTENRTPDESRANSETANNRTGDPRSDQEHNRTTSNPPTEQQVPNPTTIAIRQAIAKNTQINLFVDVRDQADHKIPVIKKEGFTVDIGPYATVLEQIADSPQIDDIAPGFAIIFLIDTSKSISASSFARVRSALGNWVRSMNPSDKAAIITFGSQVNVEQDFTSSKDSLLEKIVQIQPKELHTKLHDGLLRALDFGERRDEDLGLRRVIVLLSDGLDDATDGASAQEVQLRLEHASLPVYPIAFDAGLSAHEKEMGLKVLGSFARASGGELFNAGKDQFESTYDKVHQKAAEPRLLRVVCKDCPPDGRVYPIQISYQENSRVVTAQGHVRMSMGQSGEQVADTPDSSSWVSWLQALLPSSLKAYASLIGGLLLMVAISPFAFLIYKRLSRPADTINLDQVDNDDAVILSDPSKESDDVLSAAKRIENADKVQISPSPGIQLRLTVVKGGEIGKSWGFILNERINIGRSSSCEVAVKDDPEISGKHCYLIQKDGQLFVIDSGSTNGTTVNGIGIMTAFKIQENDLIGLGRTTLRLSRA
jgi:Mg-chelatase subunit ChlD